MGGPVRSDIHERFTRVVARVPSAVPEPRPLRLRVTPPPNAKLSPRRVAALKRLRGKHVTLEELARRFHISISTASRAVNGLTWRDPAPAAQS